jgi:ATP/maltotriose-dependent transcriptional regulator MalT
MEIGDTFELAFARPQLWWLLAVIRMGLRDYRSSAKLLEKLEHLVAEKPSSLHELNARVLRARFLIVTGRASEGLAYMMSPPQEPVFRVIKSEYLATAALTYALNGETGQAKDLADKAERISKGIEGRLLAASARAVCHPDPDSSAVLDLFELADRLACWDPVVVALRASRELIAAVRDQPRLIGMAQMVCTRTGDWRLAHALGVSVAGAAHRTADVLSPREQEILGLLENGLRNHEIAGALFISEATVKVHIRHIFEKLQVRTRAQAVARAHQPTG